MRVVIYGNSGSGKSTMAAQLADAFNVPVLNLDAVAWDAGPVRKPVATSVALIQAFVADNSNWVIEGCYGELIRAFLPMCTELRFLNPGTEVCLSHCEQRPWEPDKFESPEAQQAAFAYLIEWVKAYDERDDATGLVYHQAIYDVFDGPKMAYADVEMYSQSPDHDPSA